MLDIIQSDVFANSVTLLGVIVTGIFSFLVYRVTAAATKAAKETLALNKRIADREEKRFKEHREIMRMQLVRVILEETEKVEYALCGIDAMEVLRKLNEAPTDLIVQTKELAEYFNKDEVPIIRKAWDSYETYRRDYLKNRYGGTEYQILVEKAPPVLQELSNLKNILKGFKEGSVLS